MTRSKRSQTSSSEIRWVRRGGAVLALLVGWTFILLQNNFHITPPVVFVSLGYLAAVSAIYTLFRMGATAAAPEDHAMSAAAWDRPASARGELEREKRALLKAIKEAEFDHQMGKLSKADADAMIAVYRARAIEVIKDLDVLETSTGAAGTVRDRILREARARIEVEKRAAPTKKRGDDRPSAKKPKRAEALRAPKAESDAGPKPEAAESEAAESEAAESEATAPAEAARAADEPSDDAIAATPSEETPAPAASTEAAAADSKAPASASHVSKEAAS